MVKAVNYTVFIRKDYVISVIDPETMDVDAAEQIADAIEQYAQDLRRNGKPVLVLVDARPLKHDDAHARRVMFKRIDDMDFDRMAVFGVNPLQIKAADLMLLATHLIKKKSVLDKIKLFRNQQEAEQWLKDFA